MLRRQRLIARRIYTANLDWSTRVPLSLSRSYTGGAHATVHVMLLERDVLSVLYL